MTSHPADGNVDPLALLRELTGMPAAEFREDQREAIESLVDDRKRVLCVQRTGWGKSAVYFVATALLRKAGAGATIIVSPLIALMRNQVAAAERLGLTARTVNSANREDWDSVFSEIEAGEADLILISPERLANPGFRHDVLPTLTEHSGLLVVDEAHCISDWGHDFRPNYRRLADVIDGLPDSAAVLCTTATANDRVVDDVIAQIGPSNDLVVYRGSLERSSLRLEVVYLPSQAERLAWLATFVPELEGNGIVYCLTVRDTQMVADWLIEKGVDAVPYWGNLEDERRIEVERALLSNKVKVVVATTALGMGYDKPDLGFVIHFQGPGSAVAYYQQVGRAGRAVEHADAVLLRGTEDREIQDYFIKQAFPPEEDVLAVLNHLESVAPEPVKSGMLLGAVNIGSARLSLLLTTLEVEGAIEKAEDGWIRTDRTWAFDRERVQAVTRVRREEQAVMAAYGSDGRCLMRVLRAELDDPVQEDCGRCSACTGPRFGAELDADLILDAFALLRGRYIEFEPRSRYPAGGGGAIPLEERVEVGFALSVYADAGWGYLVKRGKFEDEQFPEPLVGACRVLLANWDPQPAPAWVTGVPSLRRPGLVAEFASRLADSLDLPFVPAVRKTRETVEQKQMGNSPQQLNNVRGAFDVDLEQVQAGPVLLVDDIVDSRWTMTEVGRQLRRAGVEAVHPLALATSTPR